jgi:23S rRNA pseudouridine2457 synthase
VNHESALVVAFWKPYGVLTAFTDRQGRATLADHIEIPEIYPAGRLDRESEGLLLLPRSPTVRRRLTEGRHPRRYLVQVEGRPTDDALGALRDGVELGDGPTSPAEVEMLEEAPDLAARSKPIRVRRSIPETWIRLTITEGRNRQVRRMTASVGHPTLRLVREAIGPITLDGLTDGSWRELGRDELAALSGCLVNPPRRGGPSQPGRGRPRRVHRWHG